MKAANYTILATLLVLFGLYSIVTTYPVFNHTIDEAPHLAAGLQLIDRGVYTYELQHPPLARVAIAIGPYLYGLRSYDLPNIWDEGRALLYGSGAYDKVLNLARLGNIPFFLITLLVTWLWTHRLLGVKPAIIALFILVTLPPLLGHAGVATLDVALVAMGSASLYALTLWLDKQTTRRSLLLGLAVGLAIMAKFSAIPFITVSFILLVLYRWLLSSNAWTPIDLIGKPRYKAPALIITAMLAVFWISYGKLEPEPLVNPQNRSQKIDQLFGHQGSLHDLAYTIADAPVFPIFIKSIVGGVEQLNNHNQTGHESFLLGEIRERGWWYYYLVGLTVKTPIPILVLGLSGLGLLGWQSWRFKNWQIAAPGIFFIAILGLASVISSINIGIRHILILYPLMAIGAAYGVQQLWHQRRNRILARAGCLGLLAWQGVTPVIVHPDYIAYFNLIAGSHPEEILVVSDLDWGQDLKRLEKEVQERGIQGINIACSGTVDLPQQSISDFTGSFNLRQYNFPGFKPLEKNKPVTGWVAISLEKLKLKGRYYGWLEHYKPVKRIGKSIDLYYIDQLSQSDLNQIN